MLNRIISFIYNRFTKFRLLYMYYYDMKRFYIHSGAFKQSHLEQKRAQLTMAYHILEKGLTMPNPRFPFGQEAALNLINLCNSFSEKESANDYIFIHCIEVLKAYAQVHASAGVQLNKTLDTELNILLNKYKEIDADYQISISREAFFSDIDSPFPIFSSSRHTCRHYCGTIDKSKIDAAVELANNAPSACNRQHSRVHCIEREETKQKILQIQGGNRGFGHSADKLLIITADLHDIRWPEERNDLNTNAGIFMMNLLYALHYHKIACCILNWSVPPRIDKTLRSIIEIPESENIVGIIACGQCPEEVRIARSPRKHTMEILKYH